MSDTRPGVQHAAELLAAVSLMRAAVVDDPERGMLIINQHGGRDSAEAAKFMVALAQTAARMMLSSSGYNVERTLRSLDAWAAEYAARGTGLR